MIRTMNKDNIILFIFILTGIILRLIWIEDMEWKADEQWMFAHAQAAIKSGNWDKIGMDSSGGIVNPGLSVWMFTIFSFFYSTPLGMTRCVELVNVIVILGFILFALTKTKGCERNIWLWAMALASVSPLAVLFSRKIWEQDVIVLFSMFTIIGNAYRTKRLGAFIWGAAGAMSGQVHMSGFFYAFGIFVFTVLYDRVTTTKTRYLWWVAGSIIGSIGLLPWVIHIYLHPSPTVLKWSHLLQFSFYFYWLVDALGLNIMYSMRKEFWELLKMPSIGGIPLYLIAALHLFLAGVGVYSIKRIYLYLKTKLIPLKTKALIRNYIANLTLSEFYLLGVLMGLGVFLNFSGVITFQHYLIVGFPFSYMLLVKLLLPKKRLLIAVITSQLIITITFLTYVHIHDGIMKGDYGKTYRSQQESIK